MCITTQIAEMSDEIKDLIGYSLMAKVNGRIVRHSMRAAAAQMNGPSDLESLNDALAEFDAATQSDAWFDEAGLDKDQRSDVELCDHWIRTKFWLEARGFKDIPLLDSFRFILKSAGEKRLATDTEVEQMAKLSGMTVEQITKANLVATKKEIERTKNTVLKALDIVKMTERSDLRHLADEDSFFEVPEDLNEILLEAIASGKKQAIRNSRSTKDALGALFLLKAEEDLV
jgi:hypothetical protein